MAQYLVYATATAMVTQVASPVLTAPGTVSQITMLRTPYDTRPAYWESQRKKREWALRHPKEEGKEAPVLTPTPTPPTLPPPTVLP